MSLHPASLLVFILALHGALTLRLCSFNVRSFGESKKENPEAMDIIVKVSHVRVRDTPGTFSQL